MAAERVRVVLARLQEYAEVPEVATLLAETAAQAVRVLGSALQKVG
ncbi:hypothetical protein [Streptomyces sp. NPDC054794]